MRPTAGAKGVHLDVRLPAEPLIVSGDAARLQQVVWNLISNAVKFTPSGGNVQLTASRMNGSIAVEVSDTGIGLPAQSLAHVFERFWQADSTSTRVHGGLGLGLALVRHIVEIHGGDVRATSEGEDRGSTFTVTIPSRVQPSGVTPQDTPTAHGSRQLTGLHALVVEDDASARELFATILTSYGALVDAVDCGAAAIAALERQPRDVLVIDIGLPGEDGMILLRRIHGEEEQRGRARTPAVAVTAYAGTGYRDAALAAGFTAHLPKPVLPDDLLSAVLAAWRSSRQYIG
jgi:CheY-like chemotaxis protein